MKIQKRPPVQKGEKNNIESVTTTYIKPLETSTKSLKRDIQP